MKPQAAAVRQQQAQKRREKLEESAARAQVEMQRTMNAGKMRGMPSLVQQSHGNADRGFISQDEWNSMVEAHEDSGKRFRYIFFLCIALAVLALLFLKYDGEYGVEVPQVESGKGFGRISSGGGATEMTKEELESYYRTLGIDEPAKAPADDTTDPDKQRRRENYRVRQQLKEAMKQHHEERGQLVHCGRSCEAKNQQIEVAYNKLASQVDRELFGVLLDAKDTKSKRSTTPAQLKKTYEEKKKKIEETETNEEDRNMALEELKDAYDIIQDPDARKYYLLYGYKPPERMRYVSARDGGWGQDLTLGTYKYRIIIMWLDFLHESIGTKGEAVILVCVILFLLARIPLIMSQMNRVVDDLEWSDNASKEEEEAKKAQGK